MIALKRLIAYWVDFCLLAAVLVGAQWFLYTTTNGFPFNSFQTGYQIAVWVMLTISLPVWLYFILLEYYFGQTFGKKLLHIQVVGNRVRKFCLRQAILRTVIKIFPWELTHLIILLPEPWWSVDTPANMYLILIPNGLIVVYILFLFCNGGTRAIHDLAGRTRVVVS